MAIINHLEIGIIKNKKVVVTGGLEFIGSHIVEELYHDNQVFIVDNEATCNPENIENFDLDQIKSDKRYNHH